MVNSVNSAGRSGTGGADAPAYFQLTPWSPPDPEAKAKPEREGLVAQSVGRFLSDWQRRCLPLPYCAVISERLFEAYRFWCELQADRFPARIEQLVGAACAAGMTKGRHRIRPLSGRGVSQHMVLHPAGAPRLASGLQMDHAAAAFADALQAWRQAAAGMSGRGGK